MVQIQTRQQWCAYAGSEHRANELERYVLELVLPQFGEDMQERLACELAADSAEYWQFIHEAYGHLRAGVV